MKSKETLVEQTNPTTNENYFDWIINSKTRIEVYNDWDPLFGGYDYDFFFDWDHTKPRWAFIKSYYHPGIYDWKIALSEEHQEQLQSKYTLNREMEVSISIWITNEQWDRIGLAQTIIQ